MSQKKDPNGRREVICYYMDDSGARDPDRKYEGHPNNPDWFALGGLLIHEHDVEASSAAIQKFRAGWPEIGSSPLHSYEIRNRKKRYRWLAEVKADRKNKFMQELSELIVSLPIRVLACVIDRPGYNHRYRVKYGPRRWLLCRTAFNIAVERAAKFAIAQEARLRVFAERSDVKTEEQLRVYYEKLRAEGLPFDGVTSQKYAPLSQETLKNTLYEFRIKTKQSDLMQIADLVLWPVCKGGYEPAHRAYAHLQEKGKLLECVCTDSNGLLGTKYSCFDLVHAAGNGVTEMQKPA